MTTIFMSFVCVCFLCRVAGNNQYCFWLHAPGENRTPDDRLADGHPTTEPPMHNKQVIPFCLSNELLPRPKAQIVKNLLKTTPHINHKRIFRFYLSLCSVFSLFKHRITYIVWVDRSRQSLEALVSIRIMILATFGPNYKVTKQQSMRAQLRDRQVNIYI